MRRQEIAAELSSKAHAERVLQIYQRMSRDRTRRIVRADASIS
jgi:hypothetical protein